MTTTIKPGMIVAPRASGRYAVVIHEPYPHGSRLLAPLHWIDPETGDKMQCPDERCQGESKTCPIHGRNVDAHTLAVFTAHDVNYYVKEGMVSEELAKAHREATT